MNKNEKSLQEILGRLKYICYNETRVWSVELKNKPDFKRIGCQ